jgi:hypothetical protein
MPEAGVLGALEILDTHTLEIVRMLEGGRGHRKKRECRRVRRSLQQSCRIGKLCIKFRLIESIESAHIILQSNTICQYSLTLDIYIFRRPKPAVPISNGQYGRLRWIASLEALDMVTSCRRRRWRGLTCDFVITVVSRQTTPDSAD